MSSISEEGDSGPSLKELVVKNLETNGIMGKLQAQLRASVFLLLEEEFKEKNIPLTNSKSNQLLFSPAGKIAISLVQDFLQCLNLEFSLAVFGPESKCDVMEKQSNRQNIMKELGTRLSSTKDDNYPLLLQLIEEKQNKTEKENGFTNTSSAFVDAKPTRTHHDSQTLPTLLHPAQKGASTNHDSKLNTNPGGKEDEGKTPKPSDTSYSKDDSDSTKQSEKASDSLKVPENEESVQYSTSSDLSSSEKDTMSGIEKVQDEEVLEEVKAENERKASEKKEDEKGKGEGSTLTKDKEEDSETIEEDVDVEEECQSFSTSTVSEETKDENVSKISAFADYEETL